MLSMIPRMRGAFKDALETSCYPFPTTNEPNHLSKREAARLSSEQSPWEVKVKFSKQCHKWWACSGYGRTYLRGQGLFRNKLQGTKGNSINFKGQKAFVNLGNFLECLAILVGAMESIPHYIHCKNAKKLDIRFLHVGSRPTSGALLGLNLQDALFVTDTSRKMRVQPQMVIVIQKSLGSV